MLRFSCLLLILLAYCLLGAEKVFSLHCYSTYCQNTTNFIRKADEQCLIQPVQRGEDCIARRFENLGHVPPTGKALAQVMLTAYVENFKERLKATAFNFSISNVDFTRLITRYQSLWDENSSACRQVEFFGNITLNPLKEFYVACPFSNDSFENSPYRLEYLISTDSYEYSRKLVFVVPSHRLIDNFVFDVKVFTPFIYIDVSDSSTLTLYVQPLPQKFKVTTYKAWMINSVTNITKEVILGDLGENHPINYSFKVDYGEITFKVAALHPSCQQNGCVNSTSPPITIKQTSHRLLIMIISIIWIPPVMVYALYHAHKLYKKKEMMKHAERKPKCLLVYSPSHMAHVNTMIDLARYLRCCNINAMIDALDIPESTNKDPVLWCNEAFHLADVIIVATSPQTDDIAPVIYRNMDSQALRLLKENYPRRSKRYYAIQFPYCKPDDIPKEARQFKRFYMPEELDKLVRTIHQVEYIRYYGVSDRDFMDSIALAKMQVISTERSSPSTEENDDLLLPDHKDKKTVEIKAVIETKGDEPPINKNPPKIFKTNIEELNLLGEINDGEIETYSYDQQPSGSEFRIDTLNL